MRHVERGLGSMEIEAKTQSVLDTLRKNLETHAQVVREAKVGWKERAERVLREKIRDLTDGKLTQLMIHLDPPKDHTKAYELAISMLEMHTGGTITLDGEQVRNLIRDEWEWSEGFWLGNEHYSATASVGAEKYK